MGWIKQIQEAVRNILCQDWRRHYAKPIVVEKHVAGVGAENYVDSGTAADDEREKCDIADVNANVLKSRRTVKYSTWKYVPCRQWSKCTLQSKIITLI